MRLCLLRICTNSSISYLPWVHLIWEKYYSNGKLPNHTRKGSFCWKDVLKLLDKFKGMATISIQYGESWLLSEDLWLGQVPKIAFSELYSFTKKPIWTVAAAKASEPLIESFHLLSLSTIDSVGGYIE